MSKMSLTALLLASSLTMMTGCAGGANNGAAPQNTPMPSPAQISPAAAGAAGTTTASQTPAPSPNPSPTPNGSDKGKPAAGAKGDGEQVVAKPDSIAVLVNKQFSLPADYEPTDLVYPDVPFTFKEKIDKRKMRKEAAAALEKLFAGASKSGIHLAGVSAYRSYATQKTVYNNYVKTDGLEKANTYSAVPGHSEHETGLAIDVSGSDGKCQAEDCFGGTKEAEWLAKHAAEYGFIIRYPKGKEAITGYQYEPWHIRYVGTEMAKEIAAKGVTLEEYLHAVPVNAQ